MTKALFPGDESPVQFENDFIAGLKNIFEEKIVFNRLLGLKITSVQPDRVTGRIDMRHELIGQIRRRTAADRGFYARADREL